MHECVTNVPELMYEQLYDTLQGEAAYQLTEKRHRLPVYRKVTGTLPDIFDANIYDKRVSDVYRLVHDSPSN